MALIDLVAARRPLVCGHALRGVEEFERASPS
jgi:hypothetical protein